LTLAVTACAARVEPADGGADGGVLDGSRVDGGALFGDASAGDGSLTCAPPLRACSESVGCAGSTRECPVNCRAVRVIGGDVGATDGRGICTNSGAYDGIGLFVDFCRLGAFSCDRPNTACFGEAEILTRVDSATGELGAGTCIPIRDCLQLPAVVGATLGPGERLSRCTYDDQTVVTATTTAPARCQSFDGTRTCGEGCEVCPMGQYCRFASERVPTGICTEALTHCAEWPDRRPCMAAGTACVRPIRGTIDGFTDQQRAGACVPLARCRAIAAALGSEYRCDETLGAN
jgi:hypothetical protein